MILGSDLSDLVIFRKLDFDSYSKWMYSKLGGLAG